MIRRFRSSPTPAQQVVIILQLAGIAIFVSAAITTVIYLTLTH